jgi:hypothetical protein
LAGISFSLYRVPAELNHKSKEILCLSIGPFERLVLGLEFKSIFDIDSLVAVDFNSLRSRRSEIALQKVQQRARNSESLTQGLPALP